MEVPLLPLFLFLLQLPGRSHHLILGGPSLQWEPGATLLAVDPGCWACLLRRGFLSSRMSQPHAKDRHNDNMCVWVGTL